MIGISFRKLHWEVDVVEFNLHLPTLSDIWPICILDSEREAERLEAWNPRQATFFGVAFTFLWTRPNKKPFSHNWVI